MRKRIVLIAIIILVCVGIGYMVYSMADFMGLISHHPQSELYKFVKKENMEGKNEISLLEFSKEKGFEWDSAYYFHDVLTNGEVSKFISLPEDFDMGDYADRIFFLKDNEIVFHEVLSWTVEIKTRDIVYFDVPSQDKPYIITHINPVYKIKKMDFNPDEYSGPLYILTPQNLE